jgi:hypothetical protein
MTLRQRLAVAGLALASLLVLAPAALADTVDSSNWAGYVAHRSGVRFTSVLGEWRVPSVDCSSGAQTFSATWVGLGGYGGTSSALEQTGTEQDCAAGGRAAYSAWFELVPAPSHAIALHVRPRDLMRATVTAAGRRITIGLADLTNHRNFTRAFTVGTPDVSSAEWIVEAPSECNSAQCVTLPLANFGQEAFMDSRAASTAGAGTVASTRWAHTTVQLVPGSARFAASGGQGPGGTASAGSLNAIGAGFSVRYQTPSGAAGLQSYEARGALAVPGAPRLPGGYLRH